MEPSIAVGVVWVIAIAVYFVVFRRQRRRRGRVGAAASGSVYDMLNEERRKAIEIIVEERAEARDPEHRDGNLPDLQNPKR